LQTAICSPRLKAVHIDVLRHLLSVAGRLEDLDAGRHMRQVCSRLLDPLFLELDRSLDLFPLRSKRRGCAYLSHALKCKAILIMILLAFAP
jgi:hypothetical protein